MVLHGLKRIFQKPSPELTSSERTNQLRSKTIYSGTVELSHALTIPGSNRYKTYNGPFEVVNKNGNGSLVASASYRDMLDITKGKVLINQLPLTDLTYPYYENNFGNGEIYVGNYQQFDGSFFNGAGPTGCADSVLVYDISTTGFTGPGSYNENSIGNTGPSGTVGSNQNIFIDPKHCYYSGPCTSSASYLKFVDINFKGPTGATGATGITGPSQYYAQQIISGNQYNGFRFPMSNFTLSCTQQIPSQTEGPIFCPLEPPSVSNFNIPPQIYNLVPISITPPQSNSLGAFTYYSSNHSVAVISGPNLDMITMVGVGNSTITALQAPDGNYSSGSISTPFVVNFSSFTATWEYTNNNGISYTDLSGNISIPYDNNTYTIRVKATSPVGATYTQSGTASATNAGDTALITITGTGNYTGSVTSPSITVGLGTFTATWEYNTTSSSGNGGPYNLSSNTYITYNASPTTTYTISFTTTPVNATYTQSGTASATNAGDTALITLTGTGNYLGYVVNSYFIKFSIPIYSITSDNLTTSLHDPPVNGYGAQIYGTTVINQGNVLINATMQYSLVYDNTMPLYLYFFTNNGIYYPSNTPSGIIETVTFPASQSPLTTIFNFPNSLTWTHGNGTFYTMWSQTSTSNTTGNQNLSMVITNDNENFSTWMWSGTLNILA